MSHRELSVGERAQATGCAGDHNGAFTTKPSKVDDIAFLYGLAAREMAVHVVRVRNMEDAKKYVDAVAPNTHLRPSLCAGARYNNIMRVARASSFRSYQGHCRCGPLARAAASRRDDLFAAGTRSSLCALS